MFFLYLQQKQPLSPTHHGQAVFMNKYIIYNEENRVNGCVAAEYQSIARDETHVRLMAAENGVDLYGYTIELVKEDVRDELRRPYKPYFEKDSLCA